MTYNNYDFDITNIPCFDNIDGLTEISNYLDFALSTTIKKQLPNATIEQEKYYASEKLKNLLNENITKNFTRDFNIRENITKISNDKIKFLLCKHLIELDAYNKRVKHILSPTEFIDQAAEYLTQQVMTGNFDKIQDWINQYIGQFIDSYVTTQYKNEGQIKTKFNDIALENPTCASALTQLNLEMKLNKLKQK